MNVSAGRTRVEGDKMADFGRFFKTLKNQNDVLLVFGSKNAFRRGVLFGRRTFMVGRHDGDVTAIVQR